MTRAQDSPEPVAANSGPENRIELVNNDSAEVVSATRTASPEEGLNRPGILGGSGVPWVWWRRVAGFMLPISVDAGLRTRRV